MAVDNAVSIAPAEMIVNCLAAHQRDQTSKQCGRSGSDRLEVVIADMHDEARR
jgi:hypothetical protein